MRPAAAATGQRRSPSPVDPLVEVRRLGADGGVVPETIVLPGHGDDTTIGAEAPHLDEWIDRGW